MTLVEVLTFVYYALLLSGFLILLARRRKLGSIFYVFLPLYFFNIVSKAATDILDRADAFPPMHINQFIGSFLLHTYYFLTLRNKWNRRIVIVCFVIFTAYFLYHFIYVSDLCAQGFPELTLEGMFICIFAVLYLMELYRQDNIDLVSQNLHFWLSVGNLIFFSGNMFLMGLLDQVIKEKQEQLYYINWILNLVLYSIYIKAFLCSLPTTKSR